MPRRTSSSPEVLLGLLTIESMSGYDLGQLVRSSIQHFWNESYGQIYPNLRRLAAAGCIKGRVEKQKGKPDRQIYSITAKGRERLARWLEKEPQPEVPRNELLLKLFFGAQAPPQRMRTFLEQMVERERAALGQFAQITREIDANPQFPDQPYWRMVVRFGELEVESHLRWSREVLGMLAKLDDAPSLKNSTRKETRRARI